jgi:hypothetical protein
VSDAFVPSLHRLKNSITVQIGLLHPQPFLLPHCCGTGDLPSLALPAQINYLLHATPMTDAVIYTHTHTHTHKRQRRRRRRRRRRERETKTKVTGYRTVLIEHSQSLLIFRLT